MTGRAPTYSLINTLLALTVSSMLNAFAQPVTHQPTSDQASDRFVLPTYVATADSVFSWTLLERSDSGKGTFMHLSFTSQRWRTITWRHQLFVFFPATTYPSTTGFLSLQMGFGVAQAKTGLMQAAEATGVPCAILSDVPNQPLFNGKQEEELLNYTFEQYIETREATWPLLLPMVKGAVRAMDVLQAVGKRDNVPTVGQFVVAGHSKRGHTAWLTAAIDKRITGLIAQGFNTLNSAAQIPHYFATYGKLDQSALAAKRVIDQIKTPNGQSLLRIVDAYNYRAKLTVPKLVIVGTNDDYTPVDALNLYWPGLSGPKSVLSLVNTGHVGANADPRLFPTAYAFIRAVAVGNQLPVVQSRLRQATKTVTLTLTTNQPALNTRVWTAHSRTNDFRAASWQEQPLPPVIGTGQQATQFSVTLNKALTGYTAIIGEAEFGQASRFALSTTPYVIGTN